MKKLPIFIISVIYCWIISSPQSSIAQQWTVKLRFYEDSVLKDSLEFGINSTATDQIDKTLGESELPPLPPFGNFDVRFTGSTIGLGLKKDIRKAAAGQKVHTIEFQRSSYSSVLKVEWDTLPEGDFVLQDKIGGILINRDMSAASSLTITNTNITGLKLFITLETGDIPTPVENDVDNIPDSFILHQNYPNPFNPSTTIKFDLPAISKVSLTVFNSMGQKVKTLASGSFPPGTYRARWDGTNNSGVRVSSGIYFYIFRSGKDVRMKKMLLVK